MEFGDNFENLLGGKKIINQQAVTSLFILFKQGRLDQYKLFGQPDLHFKIKA